MLQIKGCNLTVETLTLDISLQNWQFWFGHNQLLWQRFGKFIGNTSARAHQSMIKFLMNKSVTMFSLTDMGIFLPKSKLMMTLDSLMILVTHDNPRC